MKPTQEQIIAWAREAGLYVDEDGEILEGDGWHTQTIFVQKAMTLAYEAGRKDENEDCAKQVGQHWDAFEELKAAHYRNSPEPFDPFRFHRDLSTIFFSRDMAEAIRARRE